MGNDIKTALRPAIVMTILFTLLLGLAYPLALTGLGQLLFPHQANGSLIREADRIVGSEIVGQSFVSDRYFHGRPSAAGSAGYDGTASAGSNLGPTSKVLHDRVQKDIAALGGGPVPADLVTTSGSGLDPHISPEAAAFQIRRVAKARGMRAETLKALVAGSIEQPLAGVLGEQRVNVLLLNRKLDNIAR